MRLGADEGLGTEGAPHRRDDDPDVLRGDPEDAGQVLAHVERRLGAGDHLEPPADPLGVGRVRLHRHVRRRRGVEDLVDDHLRVVERVGERLVGIGQVGDDADLLATPQVRGPDAEPVAHVRAVLRSHVEVGRVGLGGVVPLVDQGCLVPERCQLVVHGGPLLVADLHQGRGHPGVLQCRGDDCGDGVADELGLAGQHDLVGDLAAEPRQLFDVVGGDEDDLVVEESGLEPGDAARGHIGPDDPQVPLTGDPAVDRVADCGGDPGVDAGDRRAGAGRVRPSFAGRHEPTAIRARRTSTPTTRRRYAADPRLSSM